MQDNQNLQTATSQELTLQQAASEVVIEIFPMEMTFDPNLTDEDNSLYGMGVMLDHVPTFAEVLELPKKSQTFRGISFPAFTANIRSEQEGKSYFFDLEEQTYSYIEEIASLTEAVHKMEKAFVKEQRSYFILVALLSIAEFFFGIFFQNTEFSICLIFVMNTAFLLQYLWKRKRVKALQSLYAAKDV